MKYVVSFISVCCFLGNLHAQDSILQRIIFIGDAGEINREQGALIPAAAGLIIPGRTTVVYLGDNIYPRGMALDGGKKEEATADILRSQYGPMRGGGAPVYFIPGNHDWDKMGRDGLAKIKRQWFFLDAQADSLLKMVPPNGCPDPVEINISKEVTIIVFDSEWWLFPFDKTNSGAGCNCKTKKDVVMMMGEILYRNRKKIIFLASHHPFQSYGTHGGYFGWKDNIFPLTAAVNDLYIPLPVVGSLYPILRRAFNSPEDLHHPLYKNMIRQVDAVFDSFPNLIHVAGHEHGLQLIKDDQLQIVSGGGAKETFAIKGEHSLFAEANTGFVTADLRAGRNMVFTYYVYQSPGIKPVFHYEQQFEIPVFPKDTVRVLYPGDSARKPLRPAYDEVGHFHRVLFGENYRKEWATPTQLPLIRISSFHGGLKPLQRGGGMQSNSLRLVDSSGKEWVIRSVEKTVDLLLPESLRSTFARDVLDDVTSGQHPFSALVVPPIAEAVNIPHSHPIIGIIAPDKKLGYYEKSFANTICLIEEREPIGKSDNTGKMLSNLQHDNDNTIRGKEFLRARMLDMYIGDWDRHEDQWRWRDTDSGKEKHYTAVPRDRDQVFHVTQGWLPRLASKPYLLPTLQNFGGRIEQPKYSMIKTNFLNANPAMQFDYEDWMKMTRQFTSDLTDSVLETALRRLPPESYALRYPTLIKALRDRREDMPRAMDVYYKFINKIADIKLSDKNELVDIQDVADGSLLVSVHKINKEGEIRGEIMQKTYRAGLTREIRIYTGAGKDSISINNKNSTIALRIIGGDGNKSYQVSAARQKINLYDQPGHSFYGESERFRKHLSADSLNTTFVPVNLYNTTMPLLSVAINPDDGFLLGAGFIHTGQEGFRKTPYAHQEQLLVYHSFSTRAFNVSYRGEWIRTVGNADLTFSANVYAPDNTQNFYGTGNETVFIKSGDYKRYYRARFNLYEFMPALRWGVKGRSTISIGPALQFYHFEADDNRGRYIEQPGAVTTYDSTSVGSDRAHAGLIITYIQDTRNNKLIPTWGSYLRIQLRAMEGINAASKNLGQGVGEVALYKSVNRRSTLVLADRLGGTFTLGDPAFYQTAYLGGQGTLLGYSKFRFSGQNALYNNFEVRAKLADLLNYVLPGQLGVFGFFDIGRVWQKSDPSNQWHNGFGGGFYFSPAQMAVIQLVAGYSREGWYPYLSLGFRF